MRTVCKGEEEQRITLESMQCSTPSFMRGWRGCLDQSHRQFDYVAKNSSVKDAWPNLCCIQTFQRECVQNIEMLPECEYKEHNSKKLFALLFDVILKDFSDISCGRYRTRAECDVNNFEGMEELIKVAASRRRSNSPLFFGPLIDLLPKLIS